jgi:hypothetical protein
MINKLTLLFLSIVFPGFYLTSQILTNSPLSYQNLGQKSIESDAIYQSLGFATYALADSSLINYNNPATYSYFGSGYTLLSTGIHGRISQFEENGLSNYGAFSNLNHLILGMRITKFVSFSFGLKPYSFRGYNFQNKMFTGTDSLLYSYKGTGTTQVAFGGLSIRVLNLKTTKVSIGANGGFLFGSVSNDRISRIINSGSSAGGIEKNITQVSSFYYQGGIHFQQKIGLNSIIDLGISYEPEQNLSAKFTDALYYSNNVFNEKNFDTISLQSIKGSIRMPSSFNVGTSYTLKFKNIIKNNRRLNSEMKLFLSYSKTDYASYSANFDSLTIPNIYAQNNRYGFGFQIIPEKNYFENNTLTKFYQRLYYRAGIFNDNTRFLNSSDQLNHFGITFGIGIPIFAQQSLSSINLGVNLGKIQKNIENTLSEDYVSINLGVNLSPSIFDKWFRKRKLD